MKLVKRKTENHTSSRSRGVLSELVAAVTVNIKEFTS